MTAAGWAPDYVDAAQLEDFVRANPDDIFLPTYGTAASRAVDGFCNRQFGRLLLPTTWTYDGHRAARLPSGRWLLHIDDVQDVTGLTVTVDGAAAAAGVDGYQLWERNAADQGYPYTGITLAARPYGDVEVFARFGWTTVPAAVMGATWLQVNRWHVRRESPYGTAGSPGEGTEIRLTAVLDPDVRAILAGGRLIRKRMPQ
jgi:hypothetical protein